MRGNIAQRFRSEIRIFECGGDRLGLVGAVALGAGHLRAGLSVRLGGVNETSWRAIPAHDDGVLIWAQAIDEEPGELALPQRDQLLAGFARSVPWGGPQARCICC